MEFDVMNILFDCAVILLATKLLGMLTRKLGLPQVVGMILAGLLIGPCVLNLVQISDSISIFAEIGVVMLMFTTGLGTNLKELIKAGPIATLIATVGVAVPLVGGTLLYGAFYGFAAVGSPEFYRALFIGQLLTEVLQGRRRSHRHHYDRYQCVHHGGYLAGAWAPEEFSGHYHRQCRCH